MTMFLFRRTLHTSGACSKAFGCTGSSNVVGGVGGGSVVEDELDSRKKRCHSSCSSCGRSIHADDLMKKLKCPERTTALLHDEVDVNQIEIVVNRDGLA